MVSQACILRTKLLVFSIRRMFNAKLKVTLMGRPSGTATTISVTAIMKYFKTMRAMCNHSCQPVMSVTDRYWYKSFPVNIIKVSPAMVNPTFSMNLANLPN